MECGAVGTDCTVTGYGTVGCGEGETAVRETERNSLVGRRRTFCYNTVTVINKQKRM